MRPRFFFLLCALAAFLFLGTDAVSRGNGILPNGALTLTRVASSSCGSGVGCHRVSPFLTDVSVDIADRVLALNATTQVKVTGVNSGVAGTWGGFCADVTSGVLVPGATSRTNAQGSAITHVNAIDGRSWTFNYQATRTGLVELYTVVNAVNGNGQSDGGDEWAFFSDLLVANQCTPVRMFVNADGVTSTGAGCEDGYGNQSVLGAPNPPDVGNAAFRLEAHGLPAAARFLLMISLGGGAVPAFDMAPMGASGCVLRTAISVSLSGVTSPGDSLRGEGQVVLPVPIPNDASLRGARLLVQVGALDSKPKRAFPLIVTNGLEIKIR